MVVCGGSGAGRVAGAGADGVSILLRVRYSIACVVFDTANRPSINVVDQRRDSSCLQAGTRAHAHGAFSISRTLQLSFHFNYMQRCPVLSAPHPRPAYHGIEDLSRSCLDGGYISRSGGGGV